MTKDVSKFLIKDCCADLAILVENAGGNRQTAFDRMFDCLTDAFDDEFEIARIAADKEAAYIASGEAARDNKADEKRSWYRELMERNANES